MKDEREFRGCELVYSVAAVTTDRERLLAAVEALLQQDGFRPPRSVFALREEAVWKDGLRQGAAALRGKGQLDRWGAAAMVEGLLQSGPSMELLAVPPPFWGDSLAAWMRSGAMEQALGVTWLSQWNGVDVQGVFGIANKIAAGLRRLDSTPSGPIDEYTREIHDGWAKEAQATLAELLAESIEGEETLLLVPRIASGPIAAEMHRAPELFAAAENAFDFLAALEDDPRRALGIEAALVSDAMLALIVSYVDCGLRDDAQSRERLADAVKEPKVAARIRTGAADERTSALFLSDTLEHYGDAFEEFVYLALDATFEGEEDA